MGDQLPGEAVTGFVIATYREIAARFGLGSTDAARTRARRAGWEREPANHPLDPARVRVPLIAWEQAPSERPRSSSADQPLSPSRRRGSRVDDPLPINHQESGPIKQGSDPIKVLADAAAILREQLEEERQRSAAVRALADQRASEVASLRERVDRAETDRERADRAEAQAAAERARADQATQEWAVVREALRLAQGEVEGLKHGMEHLQEVAVQARRQVEEAQCRAAAAAARAEAADRVALAAKQELERLQSRSWWRRLLGVD